MKTLFISSLLLFLSASVFSQSITGNWEGSLRVQDNVIPVVFHFRYDSTGHLNARFDSPDQGAFDLPCNEVIHNGDSIFIRMKVINGSYRGLLNSKHDSISGMLFQGAAIPLKLHKTSEKASQPAVALRSQTPHPPYPYQSEEVEYENADHSIHFGATFTVPLPDSTVNYFRRPVYPAVLLITGSGAQDRDETIFNHKPFAVLADYLTRAGIAVLRVDDRGMGKTSGRFSAATTADFAEDAIASLNYLRSRPDVDTNFIGLIGHSEGGMIAPMVAARRSDIKFIVMLAGPGVPIINLMKQQNTDVLESQGIPAAAARQYGELFSKMATAILTEKDSSKVFMQAEKVFTDWQKTTPDSIVEKTTNVCDSLGRRRFIKSQVSLLRNPAQPWFNYFMQVDPAAYLQKVSCPILALNGEKDIQVAAKPNLDAIKKITRKAGNRNVTTAVIPGCNHLFQHCKACTVAEYGLLTETIAPEVLQQVGDWIKKTIQ